MKEVAVLIRFDTEDFLTPESDAAALAIADLLTNSGARATFPVTAWKVRALRDRDRRDVLAALGRHDVGFHSTSHSLHPTIAEELETTPDGDAAAAFERREGEGMGEVAAAFGRALSCYTQPGANWVTEASTALHRWGIPLHFGEDWNAYVDVAGRPFYIGGTLHFSGAVACPKPFLSQLPGAADDALALVETAIGSARDGSGDVGLVNVVAHPTELVTEVFWDAVNFGGGVNREARDWSPPPVRPAADVRAALEAFSAYVQRLRALPGVTFWGAGDLVRAFPDVTPGVLFDHGDAVRTAASFATGRIGAVAVRGTTLSPAEAVVLICRDLGALEEGRQLSSARLDTVQPCYLPEPDDGEPRVEAKALLAGARSLAAGGAWPVQVAGLPMTAAAGALANLLLARLAQGDWPDTVDVPHGELLTRRWVRPEDKLHWDWAIFRPGFRAPRLRQRALAASWALRPAEPSLCDYRLD